MAARIHDIGNIEIPAQFLIKRGPLCELEYSIIKEHPEAGYEILRTIGWPWPIAEMILQHHERLDGSGYPRGLKGNAIITEARVLAVSDVVEAMLSERPYRPALGPVAAIDEIVSGRGTRYDPEIADICTRLLKNQALRFPPPLIVTEMVTRIKVALPSALSGRFRQSRCQRRQAAAAAVYRFNPDCRRPVP